MIKRHENVAKINITSAFSTPSLQNALTCCSPHTFICSSLVFDGNKKSKRSREKTTISHELKLNRHTLFTY